MKDLRGGHQDTVRAVATFTNNNGHALAPEDGKFSWNVDRGRRRILSVRMRRRLHLGLDGSGVMVVVIVVVVTSHTMEGVALKVR